jgi:hypothetical protein
VASAFVAIQAADVIFPRIPLPDWTVGLVVWLALLGFPIALALAWAFDVSGGTIRRTGEPWQGDAGCCSRSSTRPSDDTRSVCWT